MTKPASPIPLPATMNPLYYSTAGTEKGDLAPVAENLQQSPGLLPTPPPIHPRGYWDDVEPAAGLPPAPLVLPPAWPRQGLRFRAVPPGSVAPPPPPSPYYWPAPSGYLPYAPPNDYGAYTSGLQVSPYAYGQDPPPVAWYPNPYAWAPGWVAPAPVLPSVVESEVEADAPHGWTLYEDGPASTEPQSKATAEPPLLAPVEEPPATPPTRLVCTARRPRHSSPPPPLAAPHTRVRLGNVSAPPKSLPDALATPTPQRKVNAAQTTGDSSTRGRQDDSQDVKKQVLGILNRLSPDNYNQLLLKILALADGVSEKNSTETLDKIALCIHRQAIKAPLHARLYADVCAVLHSSEKKRLTSDPAVHPRVAFRRALLNACQKFFECPPPLPSNFDTLSAVDQSDAEGKRRDQALGNIQLVGQLFRRGLLCERLAHVIIQRLLWGATPTNKHQPSTLDILMACHLLEQVADALQTRKLVARYTRRLTQLRQKSEPRISYRLQDTVEKIEKLQSQNTPSSPSYPTKP